MEKDYIRSIDKLHEVATRYSASKDNAFRGQGCETWPLESTLRRAANKLNSDPIKLERRIVREFQRRTPQLHTPLPGEKETLEWLSLMRHHGAPCRLVDFSYSFWIGVFFAVSDPEWDSGSDETKQYRNCALYIVNLKILREREKDDFEKPIRFRLKEDSRGLLDKNSVVDFAIVERSEKLNPWVFEGSPYFMNHRFACQQGHFLFPSTVDRSFVESLRCVTSSLSGDIAKKYVIDGSLRIEILKLLLTMNISAQTLMPGLDGLAESFWNAPL